MGSILELMLSIILFISIRDAHTLELEAVITIIINDDTSGVSHHLVYS
jgi:hypothetical protein